MVEAEAVENSGDYSSSLLVVDSCVSVMGNGIPSSSSCGRQEFVEQRPTVFVGHFKCNNLGTLSRRLGKSDPGPLLDFKWLLLPTKSLGYISSSDPSGNLKEIVGFILKSYMPVWFFQAIQTSRYLSDELLQVVDPVIQLNAFFEHTENVLLAILVNEREHIRELVYRRILK
ncbi:hypothetical protein AVEN_144378-1 [Araneus ventricosus]|uniref:Uncharacterized protein n=1 Tax=Araneus ventricosus TaxID=182803 RepID=A0A4Y2E8L8_ARAVE|nr:hypothetical protein AVEN_144378-1 [Araneus ventricosus]